MINNEIKILLKKAEELRALFILGQKVIPFLEEVFVFVGEIQPLFDEINKSLTENLQKMPNASHQLTKVTEATEHATNDIMDLVDGILFNTESLNNNLHKIQRYSEIENTKPLQVLELIYNAIENGQDLKSILPELKTVIENLKNIINKEKAEIVINSHQILQTIKEDSTSILISLQVQDITSQQIFAVNKLLETVQIKLKNILRHLQESDFENIHKDNSYFAGNISAAHSDFINDDSFDPQAIDSITHKHFRQNEVDEYIKESKEKLNEMDEIVTGQNEIDAIFNNPADNFHSNLKNDIPEQNLTTKEDENKIIDSFDDFESISQDDIDKLFN